MGVYDENSRQFLLSSSSESQDFEYGTSKDEFYEEIEAPKFVDFTSPHHYRPDDRYWFCQRVGCDQKHEEEMDSETVYKNFVLRVMAARSPNVRIRKGLDKNAARTPTKCPYSAPPKSSRPRLSRLDIVSSISPNMVVNKRRVIRRPLLKPESSTPVTKAKPVAAKYLTTPRNKKCLPKTSPFHSVQNPKPSSIEVSKTLTVTKVLVFHSPKKAIKVNTCAELRIPITNLCEGVSELEISSQRKHVLGYSSSMSSRKLNNSSSGTKSVRSSNSATIGKLSRPRVTKKLLGTDGKDSSMTNEGQTDTKQQLTAEKTTEEKLHNSIREDAASVSPAELQLLNDSDSGPPDDSITNEKYLDFEGNKADDDRKQHNNCMRITSESDDKENAAVSDENRMYNINQKGNGRKIFSKVKKVVQAPDKYLKGGAESSSGHPVIIKLKKPKPTNPKPFRLRTDERGILKETKMEESRTNHQSETSNWTSVDQKLQGKQKNDFKVASSLHGLRTPEGQKKAKLEASTTPSPRSGRKREQPKLASKSIQRIEKTRKITPPLQKQHSVQPQRGAVSTKEDDIISYLVPGQKLDVIPEISPQVSELRKPRKRPVTIPVEPRFRNTHVPRSCCCTNKLK